MCGDCLTRIFISLVNVHMCLCISLIVKDTMRILHAEYNSNIEFVTQFCCIVLFEIISLNSLTPF